MRLVPKDTQKQIYSYIKKLPYNWKNKSPKTIPGWTEGLFDWLSLNYDNIKYNKATSGALDLGGASTQLAFDIKNINSKKFASQSKDDKKVTKIKLNKKNYEIFSISFLGLGQDKAREHILKTSPNSFYYCFPKDTPVTLNTSGFNIISQGKFRPALCSWAAKRVIDQNDVYAKVHKYLTSEVTSKFNNKKFNAFSGFFYTSDFFDKSKNLKELEKSIRGKCTKNWNNFKKNNLDTKPEYLINECINGSYALELLHNGYKFPVNRSDKVQFIPDADWTKGAALYYFLKSKE